MFRQFFTMRLRRHARKVFAFLFHQGFDGEVFLCGGAFTPLLKKGQHVHDLDLWVRNQEDREKLCATLLNRGAVLLQDFKPFCLKFRLEGQIIEVSYHNVGDASLSDVLHTFDLAISGMGARFHHGKVVETIVHDECWHSVRSRELAVMDSYRCLIMLAKTPCLLRTLHRMGQKATELGYKVATKDEHRLWDIYWRDYSEEERRVAMDMYFDTMVSYKGQHNERIVHKATAGYTTITRIKPRQESIQMVPKVA